MPDCKCDKKCEKEQPTLVISCYGNDPKVTLFELYSLLKNNFYEAPDA